MPGESYLLYALIVACEVGFWVILLLALAVRYVRREERLSRVLLFCLPLIDRKRYAEHPLQSTSVITGGL